MASGSGYFKGEKKRKKKGGEVININPFSTAPTLVMPKIIPKKKIEY